MKCDTKSQAQTLYGRLKADIREGKYFPDKFKKPRDITLRAWSGRYLDGSTNRGLDNERRCGRRWLLLPGNRTLTQITTEDLCRVQSKMMAAMQKSQYQGPARRWSNGTINRHFAFIRHMLILAMDEGKIPRSPARGIKELPEPKRTRYLSEEEVKQLEETLDPKNWRIVAFAIETAYGERRNSSSHGTKSISKPDS